MSTREDWRAGNLSLLSLWDFREASVAGEGQVCEVQTPHSSQSRFSLWPCVQSCAFILLQPKTQTPDSSCESSASVGKQRCGFPSTTRWRACHRLSSPLRHHSQLILTEAGFAHFASLPCLPAGTCLHLRSALGHCHGHPGWSGAGGALSCPPCARHLRIRSVIKRPFCWSV